ncbi:hypothetical protein [Amycolatopsis taiwanensis]|uniref:Uncharacterized protein n=1 Tax=Amycolatopsis taiwanensis TaxID=342230 RepID=A0A9W6VJP6_9PSEU|nr:hypothetical protein [Amycolatopsis taiwanensis]GLY68736.1 hypothetical protein Atai01_53550 [Amycolatopsis taiwanensis]
MNDDRIATVGELIAALTDYDPATPVRIATESAAFMDHTIGHVVCSPGDPDSGCVLLNDAPVVRIGAGEAYCCLPDSAANALGWS